MPTTGEAGYRYPTPGAIPDVPLDLQKLAQDVARVTDSVATVPDLPATGNWAGRVKIVRSTPGAIWQWTGATWAMHGVANFTNATTRAAAIPAPAIGMRSFLEDTQVDYRYDGTTWQVHAAIGPWKTYTPTLTGFVLGTTGAVNDCTWRREGIDSIHVRYRFVIGSAGATSPVNPAFALPVPAKTPAHVNMPLSGQSSLFRAVGNSVQPSNLLIEGSSNTTVRIYYASSSGGITYPSGTTPFGNWGAGDVLQGEFWYTAAS